MKSFLGLQFAKIKSNPFLIFFILYLILSSIIFRSLLFNFSTNLIDWRDYALVAWIINQNIEHLLRFDFTNYFNTNAFYPHPYSLLFSDVFLPQAIIGLPIFVLTGNAISTFNFIFFTTLILNYISTYLFWKQIFKNYYLAFIGALFINFSPFFHIEFSHFQSLSIWPFFFCLYFLFKNDQTPKLSNLLLTGIFLAVQFLAGVYLAVFLIFTLIVYFILKVLYSRRLFLNLKSLAVIFLVFILIDGVFINGYGTVKNYYHTQRAYEEFVTYSAHLTDYLFSKPIDSLIHRSSILSRWNSYDKNFGVKAVFPGFLLLILAFIGIFQIEKAKNFFKLIIPFNFFQALFGLLLMVGFIFSLGPRLSVNGVFVNIPLPYTIFLKLISFLEVIRVTARWSFLFYFALIFFALFGLSKFEKSSRFIYIISVVIIFFILEYLPLNLATSSENYINSDYQTISEICKQNTKVLLEIPVTHLDSGPSIVDGVTYMGKTLMSSTFHKCKLINGYSGYDMPELYVFRDRLNFLIDHNDTADFTEELKKNNIDIVKINQQYLLNELKIPVLLLIEDLKKSPNFQQIGETTFLLKRL